MRNLTWCYKRLELLYYLILEKWTKDENFCGNVKDIILNHKNIIFITDVMTFIDTIYSS